MPSADAAGLGKLTVTSALGQPLRAEIDLTAVTREEATSLAARLASPEAFRQAGIEYNAALLGVRFTVSRRPSGQFFISLQSTQPINEPFVDMLVELNWATGRLVREYTFLLDPVEMRPSVPQSVASEPKPVAQPETPRAAEPAPAPAAAPAAPARAPVAAAKPAPAEKPAPAAKLAPAPAPSKPAGSYEVKRGDTLGKIARDAKRDGVSLEQMLVAIQRSNPDAFVGGNINRLKTGAILNLPDKDAAAAIDAPDARRIVAAQSADWRAYQEKLAGGVQSAPAAKAEAPKQEAKGRITAKVEDKAQKGDAKDQLRLSKADPQAAKDGGKAAPKAAEEDKVAAERALRDAKAREAELQKNVKDLQKLAEVKNQKMAELQKQADAKAAAPAPAPAADAKKAEPPKAAPAPAPSAPAKAEPAKAEPPKAAAAPAAAAPAKSEPPKAEPPKASEPPKAPEPPKAAEPVKAAEPAKTAEAAKAAEPAKGAEPAKAPDAAKPAEPPKAEEAPKAPEPPKAAEAPKAAEEPKPAPKKAAAPPPPPPPEPSLMDEFIDNPLYLAGGGGVLALLGGYAAYAVRRKRKVEKFENSIITGGDLKANSVFGNTGGQNVDTGNSSFQSDFSQVSTGSIDADEVDPVAEADVYMAYGRDAQAEEILKEALAKDGSRHAVRVKLMEIYSQRSDTASFENHAKELHAATGGQGDHWTRAAELGRALMPGNPLFGTGGAAASDSVTSTVALGAGALSAAAAAAEANDPSMESTMQMAAFPGTQAPASPESLSKTLSLAPVQQAPASLDVDFDLGGATPAEAPSAGAPDFVLDATPTEAASDPGAGLDFDIGGSDNDVTVVASPPAAEAPSTDFAPGGTLIMGAGEASADPAVDHSLDETQPLADVRPPDLPSPSIDFDFDLSADAPAGADATPAAAAAPAGNSMDFDLSGIDLDLPASGGAAASGDAPADDAATKLDLAKAYQDMGDKEGAKELLQEVIKEGNDAQKSEAQKLLSSIG